MTDAREGSRPVKQEATSDNPRAAHRGDRRPAHAERGSCTMYAHRLESEAGPVEARIRALVADHLGVSAEDVEPNVSLVDELAADSLDLVEIAVAIEGDLGIVLPRHFLDEVRTCGELVNATIARWKADRTDDDRPVALRARLTPAGDARPWTVERVVLLTPYAAESLADD